MLTSVSCRGPGVCEKCTKYCQAGPAACRARCEQGKTRQACQECASC